MSDDEREPIGTWIQIVVDLRDNPVMEGTLGQIERYIPVEIEGEVHEYPMIRLNDGSVIYGIECFWTIWKDGQ